METSLVVEEYRTFKRLIRLQFPRETIYLLYYDDRSCLLQLGSRGQVLIDTSTGQSIRGEKLNALVRKVVAMTRLTRDVLETETINSFLRIPEVPFLLGEITIEDKDLKRQLKHRLEQHFEDQICRKQLHPLFLDQYLENVDYIFNYMLTNLGSPEESENYFNKLRLMLTQILENTEFSRIYEYFPLLAALVELVVDREEDFVIIRGKNSYCIIRSRLTQVAELEGFNHDRELPQEILDRADTVVIDLTNKFLEALLPIYKNK